MTLQTPPGRDDFLFDLTRWNRAGLGRFQYVDGDAAVWLEELRIALLGLYLRGLDAGDRIPEKWRDLFLKEETERQLTASRAEFEAALEWKDLLAQFPDETETPGNRNRRLLAQYDRQSQDHAWEIMRAFARAAHTLLGHLDAYANEGYLRTATQWDNLRKLAAMVNYQPTPPASATSTVALELEPGKGVIEIARGLAMKYAPPEGGAPVIFETLKPVLAHPDLNAVRADGWDRSEEVLDFSGPTQWIVPGNAALVQGGLAVIVGRKTGSEDIWSGATALSDIDRDEKAGVADLTFGPVPTASLELGDTLLLIEPDGVQLGLPRGIGNQLIVKTDRASGYSAGAILRVTSGGSTFYAVVIDASDGYLVLDAASSPSGQVTIEALTPFAVGDSGVLETPLSIGTLRFKRSSGSGEPTVLRSTTGPRKEHGTIDVANRYENLSGTVGRGYALTEGTRVDSGKVLGDITAKGLSGTRTVRFKGKPPKTLSQGDWYVARPVDGTAVTAHSVSDIRVESDFYFIQFDSDPPTPHDNTEFIGPMTRTLRPAGYDRNRKAAISGGLCSLKIPSPAARDLVKVGRDIIVVYEKEEDEPLAALATVTSVAPLGGEVMSIAVESERDFSDWQAGFTRFCLNTVDISHGETKDPKVLGSGDGERRRQDFRLKVTGVSFIPSNASLTGVAPDMDVTVDGVKWEFRDIADPTADGEDAWSVALNEDDTLQIHFRRRLPTGTNNVAVSRHRVGVGAGGTGVPSWSFAKPMKKNRFVSGIVQPFATGGGADREPVSDIRENAPSKLAANGRAVSLKDFERLCKRHSSVWQARARELLEPGAVNHVEIVVVPANGGAVSSTLRGDLVDFVESRALPNVQVNIVDYQSLALKMHVNVNVDTGRYDKDDVRDNAEAALVAEFALRKRSLGQPLYVAEILAAMERVEGVSSATVVGFSRKATAPQPLREAMISGSLAAIFPKGNQVAVLESVADVTVDAGGLT